MSGNLEHLPRAVVHELVERAQLGDIAARNALITSFMPLVEHLARSQRRPRIAADLIQAGVAGSNGSASGLVRAIELYRPDGGKSFSSYAYMWVRAAIQEELTRHTPAVRVNRGEQWRAAKAQRRARKIQAQTGRVAPAAAVRAQMPDGEQSSLAAVARHMAHETPRAIPHDDVRAGTGCEDDVIESMDRARTAATVGIAVAKLDMLEAVVLRLRFVDEERQTVVAKRLSTTPERIKNIELRALEKLRQELG